MRKKKEYKKICSWCGRAFTTNKIKRHFCYDCRPEQTITESHLDDNLSALSSYNNNNGGVRYEDFKIRGIDVLHMIDDCKQYEFYEFEEPHIDKELQNE